MANRPSASARARAGSTRSAPGSNSQQAILIGVGAIAVIVVLLFLFNKKSEPANAGTTGGTAAAQKPADAAPAPAAAVDLAAAKAGKTPKTPAPQLTATTLAKFREHLDKAKALFNDGVNARNAGDNSGARDKQAAASDQLESARELVTDALAWQEEAQMEDWAQPAEYMTLEKLFGEYSTLTKKVRMSGGK